MQNLERSKFEESWKETFEEAGVSPSESVWATLDQKLTQAEGDSMRRRVVFYQRMVAACILFALLAGGFGIYHWNESSSNQGIKNTSTKTRDVIDVKTKNNSGNATDHSVASKGNSESKAKSLSENKPPTHTKNIKSNSVLSTIFQKTPKSDEKVLRDDGGVTSSNKNQSNVVQLLEEESKTESFVVDLSLPQPELLPVAKIQGEPVYIKLSPMVTRYEKEESKSEKLWTSAVASSGVYTSYIGGSAYSANSSSSGSNQSNNIINSSSTGTSRSFGMLGGVRLSKRWVLQAAVQYMSVGYSTRFSTLTAYPGLYNLSTGTGYYTYGIAGTNEYVSVSVLPGYVLIDRKIGLQIGTGVASDFFLRNTLSNLNGQQYSQNGGSDSPYRQVNLAGLINTEVSYKLGKNYRISLVPGFRYSLNSVLKTQTSGNPTMWDVGFRFRYILR